MSQYNKEFPFAVAFPPQGMTNVLAETLAKQGVKQAHVAGTPIFVNTAAWVSYCVRQRLKNTLMSLSSSMAVWRSSSRMRRDI
jgi:2,3-bisphosphoglycerate-independent phosphoglycerate mutase